jgi:hypothetical protein
MNIKTRHEHGTPISANQRPRVDTGHLLNRPALAVDLVNNSTAVGQQSSTPPQAASRSGGVVADLGPMLQHSWQPSARTLCTARLGSAIAQSGSKVAVVSRALIGESAVAVANIERQLYAAEHCQVDGFAIRYFRP